MKSFSKIVLSGAAILSLASCTKKLDLLPTNDVTAAQVYSTPLGYKQAFAKVYGSFALTGNQGPAGNGDVQGIDEGTSDYLRLFWKAQELSTDEAVVGWGDVGIQDFHNMNWSADNPFLKGLYYRSFYQITLCNDFIRQASDDNLSARGISGADADNIRKYKTEARFLRAFQYWSLMDLFGNVPMVTENDVFGASLPKQAQRKDVFAYVESELKAIDADLVAPRTNEYGRADKAAAWALLARMYLNAKVYTGTDRYTDAIAYSKKVIDVGYALLPDYTKLMRADNNINNTEAIFTINYDGLKTQNYGGTTYLVHAAVGGSMSASFFGVGGGWGGNRVTKNLPNLFPDYTGAMDKRAQFYQAGQNLEITSIGDFASGLAVTKYRNVKSDNITPGSSLDFSDIDFPVFRLAEMYLIYAEAVSRGGTGGSAATALTYINNLRTRAYGNTNGNVGAYTTDFILDERGRELYWEGFRRTDLIRFDKFVENTYLWPYKGGVKDGTAVDAYRKLYPIPTADVASNPNIKQNPNY